ncbi:MAG: MarR family winged helix-turn-helix transcriptional regulator [Enterococcus sp.]
MIHNSGRLLKIASNQMVREFDQFAEQYDLTSMQMSVIDYLNTNDQKDIFQKDIENEFQIQRSTTTVLLQRMEKKDLIFREASAQDARQRFVRLTPHAMTISKKVSEYMILQQQKLEEVFSEEEIDIFEKVLQYYIK